MRNIGWIGAFVILLFVGCNQQKADHAVVYPTVTYPEDNPFSTEKAELGRRLFYEKGLSLDSSVSCASCHLQQFAFTDTARVSRGFKGDTGFRNSTSLANVAFQNAFFRDGGVHTLERAVHPPVLTEFEMNMMPEEMLERLRANQQYADLFKKSFDGELDYKSVVYALATFQRTLVSFQSRYDSFIAGDTAALTKEELAGLTLFRSERLKCNTCHQEPLFIDNELHNIGLYDVYVDYGRGRVTLDSADYGKFRTPTLRNIAVSGPYMHDGSFKSLEEVVAFYETGGKQHPNRSPILTPFKLTDKERKQLISFLEALTDSTFLHNPKFAAPN
jgi:cytochrome c peroxidase